MKPLHRWSFLSRRRGIASSGLLRKDNAVVVTKDGKSLYALFDDGTLYILALKEGDSHRMPVGSSNNNNNFVRLRDEVGMGGVDNNATVTFRPSIVHGRHIDCRSGISLQETEQGVNFAVFAVTDVPVGKNREMTYNFDTGEMTFKDEEELQSRVIAVNPDGTMRWEVSLDGYIEQTPQIGKAKIIGTSSFVYVVQNIPDEPSNNIFDPDLYKGRIVVLRDDGVGGGGGSSSGVEIAATKEGVSVVLGPVLVKQINIRGKERDCAFVAENRGDGHILAGGVYVLSPSDEFDIKLGRGNGAYDFRTLARWLRSSVTRPVVSDDGASLFAFGAGSRLAGVRLGSFLISEDDPNALEVSWETRIEDVSAFNDTEPLRRSGVLTANGRLYIAGASSSLYSLDVASGAVQWSAGGNSLFSVEPKLVESTNNLYAIEHSNGRVMAYDAISGKKNWEFNCQDINTTGAVLCQDSVEAEFTISSLGDLLIFGDTFGTIHALQIAESNIIEAAVAPTTRPIAAIQTTLPTSSSTVGSTGTESPSKMPTRFILAPSSPSTSTNMSANDGAKKNTDSYAVSVAVLVGVLALFALALAVAYLLIFRRRHKNRASDENIVEDIHVESSHSQELSLSPVNSLHSSNNTNRTTDIEAHASEKESEAIAEILQVDSHDHENGVPPPPPSGRSQDEALPRSSGASANFSAASVASHFSRTLSELSSGSNLGLETSIMPLIDLACGGEVPDTSEKEAKKVPSQTVETTSEAPAHARSTNTNRGRTEALAASVDVSEVVEIRAEVRNGTKSRLM